MRKTLAALRHAVHPHGRGDNNFFSVASPVLGGSPPRAWGQSRNCCSVGCPSRFTPTGVGTMRARESAALAGRFTPTGVGTIVGDNRPHPTHPVHPHGRGDNKKVKRPLRFNNGSPPRAWGQLPGARSNWSFIRFTPTGVGTMIAHPQRGRVLAVHPHGRGDNAVDQQHNAGLRGSPPRAWGQFVCWRAEKRLSRFTPTGVGTISSRASPIHIDAVHPHGRGDNPKRVPF